MRHLVVRLFFFNDTATTEIYTLSLHDALPISRRGVHDPVPNAGRTEPDCGRRARGPKPPRTTPAADRKSTRLNSSHSQISYAVFCLKKKRTERHYALVVGEEFGCSADTHARQH